MARFESCWIISFASCLSRAYLIPIRPMKESIPITANTPNISVMLRPDCVFFCIQTPFIVEFYVTGS